MYSLPWHLKPDFTWSTLIQTPFQKEETAAHLHDLKKQPRLDHNDHLILGCIFARNASKKWISHCTRAFYGFLQSRFLPDRTGFNPASTENTPGFLKKKKLNQFIYIFKLYIKLKPSHVYYSWEIRIVICGINNQDGCCSVATPCPTLRDPIDCSVPAFPVHHQLLKLAQTHVHWVGDAIQPSHPLSPSSAPALNPSQHQGLF